MTRHTPGPWRTFNGTDVFPDDEDREGSRHIADCNMEGNIGGDEQRANARLISAAPDLLSLARDYRGVIEFQIRHDLKRGDVEGANMKRLTLQYVESILAKATSPTLPVGGSDASGSAEEIKRKQEEIALKLRKGGIAL